MTLLRPSEILANNPDIKKCWIPAVIGYLFSFGLIRGKKVHRGRASCYALVVFGGLKLNTK